MARITKKQEFGCAFLQTNNYGGYCYVIDDGGEHSQQRGEFTVYDIIGSSYIYEAPTGDMCIANIPDGDGDTEYYRIAVLSY